MYHLLPQTGPQRARLHDIRKSLEFTETQMIFRPENAAAWAKGIPASYMAYAMEAVDAILARDSHEEASGVIGTWHRDGMRETTRLLILRWAKNSKEKVNFDLFAKTHA